jgi:hypothetical protein
MFLLWVKSCYKWGKRIYIVPKRAKGGGAVCGSQGPIVLHKYLCLSVVPLLSTAQTLSYRAQVTVQMMVFPILCKRFLPGSPLLGWRGPKHFSSGPKPTLCGHRYIQRDDTRNHFILKKFKAYSHSHQMHTGSTSSPNHSHQVHTGSTSSPNHSHQVHTGSPSSPNLSHHGPTADTPTRNPNP